MQWNINHSKEGVERGRGMRTKTRRKGKQNKQTNKTTSNIIGTLKKKAILKKKVRHQKKIHTV